MYKYRTGSRKRVVVCNEKLAIQHITLLGSATYTTAGGGASVAMICALSAGVPSGGIPSLLDASHA